MTGRRIYKVDLSGVTCTCCIPQLLHVLTLASVTTRFISSATALEILLAFLTSLLNSQRLQKAYWYTIRSHINPQEHGYRCSFHSGVFQGIDFLGEREV
jgi:hypothetical protein